jgi:hypothetical protein
MTVQEWRVAEAEGRSVVENVAGLCQEDVYLVLVLISLLEVF